MTSCRSCGAPIEFVTTRAGKSMPIDPDERSDGNIVNRGRRKGRRAPKGRELRRPEVRKPLRHVPVRGRASEEQVVMQGEGRVTACNHTTFEANVVVNRFEDTGRFMADITVRCSGCNTPFQFMGVPAGIDWLSPRVSVNALELHAPIQPNTATLAARATFAMPRKDD